MFPLCVRVELVDIASMVTKRQLIETVSVNMFTLCMRVELVGCRRHDKLTEPISTIMFFTVCVLVELVWCRGHGV
jgi:hypothetical protein